MKLLDDVPVEEGEVEIHAVLTSPPSMPGTWTRVLDQQRDAVDGEGRDEVERGHGQVDLDAARGLFLRLHREHRQLGDADRERHRRVLDDVHRLAGERRDDDAERHRQQHVAVGLRQRQAHRQAGVALALGQRLDAGACTCSAMRAEVKKPSANTTRMKLGTARSDGRSTGSRGTRGRSAPAAGCCGTARSRRCRERPASLFGTVRRMPISEPTTSATTSASTATDKRPAPGRHQPLQIGLPAPGVLQEDLPIPLAAQRRSPLVVVLGAQRKSAARCDRRRAGQRISKLCARCL